MNSPQAKAPSGADTFSIEMYGAKWAVWRKRSGSFPRIVSKHKTESAARKAVAQLRFMLSENGCQPHDAAALK